MQADSNPFNVCSTGGDDHGCWCAVPLDHGRLSAEGWRFVPVALTSWLTLVVLFAFAIWRVWPSVWLALKERIPAPSDSADENYGAQKDDAVTPSLSFMEAGRVLLPRALTRSDTHSSDTTTSTAAPGGTDLAPTPDTAAEAPPSKGELFAVDHAKFFLNSVIICHHVQCTYMSSLATPWSLAFAAYVEAWVMPTFAFLSGLLSKGELTETRAQRTVQSIWVTYALLNALERVAPPLLRDPLHVLSYRPTLPDLTRESSVVTWYLQCWIAWKMLLPYLRTIQDPFKLVGLAFALSWYGGYFDFAWWGSFHASATIGMLPMFVVGYVTPHSIFGRVPRWLRGASAGAHIAFIVAVVVMCYTTWEDCNQDLSGRPWHGATFLRWTMVMHRYSYLTPEAVVEMCGDDQNGCGGDYYWMWTQRAVYHAMAALLGAAWVCLMPNRRTEFAIRGRHSLYAYMLQFVVFVPFTGYAFHFLGKCLNSVPGLSLPTCASPLRFCVFLCTSVAGTYIMTSQTVRGLACVAFEPTWLNWLWDKPYERKPHLRSFAFLILCWVLPDFIGSARAWLCSVETASH